MSKKLTSRGANVDAKNSWGDTPLDNAARHGYMETVQFSLSHGAHVGSASGGYTAVRHTVLRGYVEIIATLLEHSATPLPEPSHNSELRWAARLAASSGSNNVIDLLLRNILKSQGHSALLNAALTDPAPVIQRVIDVGISVHRTDQKGRSAVHVAVLSKLLEERSTWITEL